MLDQPNYLVSGRIEPKALTNGYFKPSNRVSSELPERGRGQLPQSPAQNDDLRTEIGSSRVCFCFHRDEQDNSDPAPKFQVICKPNEWAKVVKHSADSKDLGATDLKKLNFWTKLKSYAAEKKIALLRQTPTPQHWYNISIGSSEANISLTLNTRENSLACEIYIENNKQLFNFLKVQKASIEQQVGAELEWIDARKASRVVQRKVNADSDDETHLTELFDWLIERAIAFEKVFGPSHGTA
jgi:hypothetical protein